MYKIFPSIRRMQNSVGRSDSLYYYTLCSSKSVFAEKFKWTALLNVAMKPPFFLQKRRIFVPC